MNFYHTELKVLRKRCEDDNQFILVVGDMLQNRDKAIEDLHIQIGQLKAQINHENC